MKKKILSLLAFMLPMMALLSSCEEEEIVFDHELPQFELREDAILLEVIVPLETVTDDNIYIVGAFNGGEEAAVGDVRWQLEKAQNTDAKWGIYLDPSTFVEGTSLADGFYFVSEKSGVERTLKNEDMMHFDNPAIGTRTNITVVRWKSYFDIPQDPTEIEHDGYVVYVEDNTGWDALSLYAWSADGEPELFGAWPGASPMGTIEKGGVTYKYFDTGEANAGKTYNLIFNNAGAGEQFDGPAYTIDRDIYIRINGDKTFEEVDPTQSVTHDGYAIFIADNSGWDALAMYAWFDGATELFGAWPGAVPTGEVTIKGVTYKYFDTGAANVGTTYNLIMNNNGGGLQFDLAQVVLDRDYYFSIDSKSGTEVDPQNPVIPEPEPEPEPDPGYTDYTIYVANNSGWDSLYIYAYGDREVFGGWPGAAASGTETIGGVEYTKFTMTAAGESINVIFNNGVGGDGGQFDGPAIVADRDYYFSITSSECTEVDPATGSEPQTYRIYVKNESAWSPLYLYAWNGESQPELFGTWPGAVATGTETVDGVEYEYWDVQGTTYANNLIFNNGVGGEGGQFDGPSIVIDKNYYFTVTADSYSEANVSQRRRR